MTGKILCSVVIIALCSNISRGIPLSATYDNSVDLTEKATLDYRIDQDSGVAHLAIHLTDKSVIQPAVPNWIGLGIGESSSGSMLGADIVTAEFSSNSTNSCVITDRYVPFVAYPLTTPPGPFPYPDDCPTPDWILVSCKRDFETGSILLEVNRPLKARETQDLPILPGENMILYAYGKTFGYHGSNRHSSLVVMYGVENSFAFAENLPSDIDEFVDILATNVTVPSASTSYLCTGGIIPLEHENSKKMIVAVEPVVQKGSENMVHHLLAYLCSDEDYARRAFETTQCEGTGNPDSPYFENPGSVLGCSTMVYGYAKGSIRILYPPEAGILISSGASGRQQYIVYQTHYDNPNNIEGYTDSSGIRVYLTSKLRKNEAATLLVGDLLLRRGQTIKNNFRYQQTCPSACTLRFPEPITIFNSLLHMHRTGKEIYTSIFDENGKYVKNIDKVNFWSDNFQRTKPVHPPIKLLPGQQLSTSCVYDTSKKPNTTWGDAVDNEMCANFLVYYPAQFNREDPENSVNYCGYVPTPQGFGLTACATTGDDSSIAKFLNENPIPNPLFNDTVGAPTSFGNAVKQCPRKLEPIRKLVRDTLPFTNFKGEVLDIKCMKYQRNIRFKKLNRNLMFRYSIRNRELNLSLMNYKNTKNVIIEKAKFNYFLMYREINGYWKLGGIDDVMERIYSKTFNLNYYRLPVGKKSVCWINAQIGMYAKVCLKNTSGTKTCEVRLMSMRRPVACVNACKNKKKGTVVPVSGRNPCPTCV